MPPGAWVQGGLEGSSKARFREEVSCTKIMSMLIELDLQQSWGKG